MISGGYRPVTAADWLNAAATTWARLPVAAPRLQALTNTVAQPLTANVLLAAGARVSMATHAAEIADMAGSADAVLINLGTLDAERAAAIPHVLAALADRKTPLTLDPVFVELSALRLRLARDVLQRPQVLVRGNAGEVAALRASTTTTATWVTTAAIDRIEAAGRPSLMIANGHPLLAHVTAVGCATSALIAVLRAITDDPHLAALTGLLVVGIAGERAAAGCHGPADFAVRWVDGIARLDAATLLQQGRLTMEAAALSNSLASV
jgi:hydroxyethylthiazole kinase